MTASNAVDIPLTKLLFMFRVYTIENVSVHINLSIATAMAITVERFVYSISSFATYHIRGAWKGKQRKFASNSEANFGCK